MPLYVYQVLDPNGDGEVFEVLQEMNDPPLTTHPETGQPVARVLAAPNAPRKALPGKLSDSRLEKLGFTKYERAGSGTYEKTAGSGPDLICRDD
jgi:predicted nucleic acid-binding Zn ribbon protein